MSGLINPHAAPEEAAYALLIELVRAQRVPQYEGEISGLLPMYDEAVKHFKEKETER
ncbi:ATP-NAD kinase [Klebsiella pneumoniae]|nr:ATP-NAD kinase [Klebsiella pneumoniae]